MFPMNHLPDLLDGPPLFVVLSLVVIGSSIPPLGIVIAAEPILVSVVLATDDGLSIPGLLAVTIGAAVVGDTVSYWLGRTFGRSLLKTNLMRRSRNHIRGAHLHVRNRGALSAMMIQRWVPPTRGFVPALIGTIRYPFGRFVGYSAIASTTWAVVLVLGSHFGGPTLILIVPTVATVILAVQVVKRVVSRR